MYSEENFVKWILKHWPPYKGHDDDHSQRLINILASIHQQYHPFILLSQ